MPRHSFYQSGWRRVRCHAVLIYFEQTCHRTFLDACRPIGSDKLACNVASFKFRDVFYSSSMVFRAHSLRVLVRCANRVMAVCIFGSPVQWRWTALSAHGVCWATTYFQVLTSRHQNCQIISKDGMVALHGITSVTQSLYQHHLVGWKHLNHMRVPCCGHHINLHSCVPRRSPGAHTVAG